MNRPSWDEYFMGLAAQVARRSTCKRRAVGAVLVRNRRILATGYNGSPPGFPHCINDQCLMIDGHCVRTIHAETNAIIQAALHGISTEGAALYCTSFPCHNCAKMLIGAGIKQIFYRDAYNDEVSKDFLRHAGIQVEQI